MEPDGVVPVHPADLDQAEEHRRRQDERLPESAARLVEAALLGQGEKRERIHLNSRLPQVRRPLLDPVALPGRLAKRVGEERHHAQRRAVTHREMAS